MLKVSVSSWTLWKSCVSVLAMPYEHQIRTLTRKASLVYKIHSVSFHTFFHLIIIISSELKLSFIPSSCLSCKAARPERKDFPATHTHLDAVFLCVWLSQRSRDTFSVLSCHCTDLCSDLHDEVSVKWTGTVKEQHGANDTQNPTVVHMHLVAMTTVFLMKWWLFHGKLKKNSD